MKTENTFWVQVMEIELRGIFVILLNRMGLTLCLVSLI